MLEDRLASSLKSVRDTARDPSLAKLAAIVEACPEAMIACGSDGRVETWNTGATQVFGLPAERMMGRNVSDLIAEGCREEFTRLLHEASVGMARMLFRTLGQHDDGRFIDLSMSLSPLRTPEGTVTGVGVVARDVSALRRAEDEAELGREELVKREASLQQALGALRTSHEELKRTQLQLIQAAKLDSVGRLAAGVAHEVKNPLAMILAGTEYLLGMPQGSNAPAAEPVLRDIRAAVDRASAVIKGLLNYASSTELDAKPSDLHAVIEQALGLTQHAMKSGHIHIQKEFASGMPPIPLDVHKIQQVFINLVINAVDAMPAGGTLTIRTQRKQLNAGDQSVGHRRTDPLRVGESVVLVAFEDSGAGITPEHLSHIFDPFFTTKPTGKGTGLGLAVSRTIVALHGGTIWVSNRPEGGASFIVVLKSATH